MVEPLLGRIGAIQGAAGRGPGLPQSTPSFTERMEDVERVVEVGEVGGATAGALELHPFTQPGAIVPDHGLERRKSGEFLGPCGAVACLDHPARQPAEALGLDDHQDGLASKKISSAVPCLIWGRAASSSSPSRPPACSPASRVARPSVATAGVDFDPAT